MSTQIALTIAAIASGLLAGFFLASSLVVNLVLSSGGGDTRRMATRTAIAVGILGGVAALSTLGAIVNHLNAPDSMNVIGPALVGIVLVLIGGGLGLFAASNARRESNPSLLTRWSQINWVGMALVTAAFILLLAAMNTLV
jgi:hypothetical protein